MVLKILHICMQNLDILENSPYSNSFDCNEGNNSGGCSYHMLVQVVSWRMEVHT